MTASFSTAFVIICREDKKEGGQKVEEESDVAALADHLRQEHELMLTDDFNKNYAFTILKLDPSNLDKCEQEWVSRLVTMKPFGLNIEKPCGVSDSVLTMAKMEKMQR